MSLIIGTHQTISKGFAAMGQDAVSIGASTIAFFLRNPRGAGAKPLDEADLAAFRDILRENAFGPLVVHAPYTLNACSATARTRELALEMITDDLARMERLPGSFYNLHPGSHVGQGAEKAIPLVADMLNKAIRPEQSTTVLLETMAGKGSEVGRSFEELAAILEQVEESDKVGICCDACHLFDGGYDLAGNLDGVLERFDKMIGLHRLKAFHINDSLNALGSRKDRHAAIGKGTMGFEATARIINHPALTGIPFIVETPVELEEHGREIASLRAAYTGA